MKLTKTKTVPATPEHTVEIGDGIKCDVPGFDELIAKPLEALGVLPCEYKTCTEPGAATFEL